MKRSCTTPSLRSPARSQRSKSHGSGDGKTVARRQEARAEDPPTSPQAEPHDGSQGARWPKGGTTQALKAAAGRFSAPPTPRRQAALNSKRTPRLSPRCSPRGSLSGGPNHRIQHTAKEPVAEDASAAATTRRLQGYEREDRRLRRNPGPAPEVAPHPQRGLPSYLVDSGHDSLSLSRGSVERLMSRAGSATQLSAAAASERGPAAEGGAGIELPGPVPVSPPPATPPTAVGSRAVASPQDPAFALVDMPYCGAEAESHTASHFMVSLSGSGATTPTENSEALRPRAREGTKQDQAGDSRIMKLIGRRSVLSGVLASSVLAAQGSATHPDPRRGRRMRCSQTRSVAGPAGEAGASSPKALSHDTTGPLKAAPVDGGGGSPQAASRRPPQLSSGGAVPVTSAGSLPPRPAAETAEPTSRGVQEDTTDEPEEHTDGEWGPPVVYEPPPVREEPPEQRGAQGLNAVEGEEEACDQIGSDQTTAFSRTFLPLPEDDEDDSLNHGSPASTSSSLQDLTPAEAEGEAGAVGEVVWAGRPSVGGTVSQEASQGPPPAPSPSHSLAHAAAAATTAAGGGAAVVGSLAWPHSGPPPGALLQNEVGSLVATHTWRYVPPPPAMRPPRVDVPVAPRRPVAEATEGSPANGDEAASAPAGNVAARVFAVLNNKACPATTGAKQRLVCDLVEQLAARLQRAEQALAGEQRAHRALQMTAEFLERHNACLQQQLAMVTRLNYTLTVAEDGSAAIAELPPPDLAALQMSGLVAS